MAEENALAEAQSAQTPEPEAKTEPVTEVAQDAGDTPSGEAKEAPKAAKPDEEKPKSRAQKRIEQLASDKRAAVEYGEYWRAQAEAVKAATEPSTPTPAPKLADFGNDAEKWAEATQIWATETSTQEALKRFREEQARTQQSTQRRAAMQSFAQREAQAAGRLEGYYQITRSQDVPITQDIVDAVADLEQGPEITYYLGLNPEQAQRISTLPATQIAREIGKLAAQAEAGTLDLGQSQSTPKPRVTKAPEPPNPIGSGAEPARVDLSNVKDINEWMRLRRKDLEKRGKF